jgi:hypothetical protein
MSILDPASRRRFLCRSLAAGAGGVSALLAPKRANAQWVGPIIVELFDVSQPNYSPNLNQGDNYQFQITASYLNTVDVCTQINGGSWYCQGLGSTDAMGTLLVNGTAGLVGRTIKRTIATASRPASNFGCTQISGTRTASIRACSHSKPR